MNPAYINELGTPAVPFQVAPGIQTDGTQANSNSCIDGQNVRFYQGKPLKRGGRKLIKIGTTDIVRKFFEVPLNDFTRVFLFRNSGISSYDRLPYGTLTPEVDHTPLGWITPAPGNPDYTFSVDSLTDVYVQGGILQKDSLIFAVGIPNSENINQTDEFPVFYMNVNTDTIFQSLGQSTSGGLIVVEPIVILYGNDGVMRFSQYAGGISDPLVFPVGNFLGVANNKLLMARTFRNSVYFWTSPVLKQVIIDFSTDPISFTVLTAAPEISIISADSVITGNNNTYYWAGINQFFQFNGTVSELPNTYNKRDFFKNVTTSFQGKVWGIYSGEFNELMWFSPQGDERECSTCYVNSRDEPVGNGEFSWYKTTMPRASGIRGNIINKPIYSASKNISYLYPDKFPIYQEETGVDVEEDGQFFPIDSHFTTRLMFSGEIFSGSNLTARLMKIEQNFVQSGEMSVEVLNWGYLNSVPSVSTPYTFNETTSNISVDETGRWLALKFRSNVVGGDFFMGKLFLHTKPSGVRPE